MKAKYKITEQEVIEKCSHVIHQFYERDIEPIAKILDNNFVWIGAYEFQYLRGRKAFLKSIKKESQEVPVHVSQEEYHMLCHNRDLWVVYGRFTATLEQEDGTFLMAKTRNTFVFKNIADKLMLMHIHGSHARDVPLEYKEAPKGLIMKNKTWFDGLKEVDRLVGLPKRISFRTFEGVYRFLLPAEIVYIKAENKLCTVITLTDSFVIRAILKDIEPLSPLFVLVHRAYLINARYAQQIQRYKIELVDKTLLPVGKERYLDVRERLFAQGDAGSK